MLASTTLISMKMKLINNKNVDNMLSSKLSVAEENQTAKQLKK